MEKNNEQVKNVWKPLCIVFAALLALSWVFFGFLYSKGGVDFSSLENPEQNYMVDGGGMLVGESTGNGVALMSAKIAPEDFAANDISPMAETAYQLTATITPDDAANKKVDWSVSFVDPASSWATGKTVTSYVTITPTSDGALTANVECKAAFGSQIKITVKSRDNSSASASCTVDYVQKLESISLSFGSLAIKTVCVADKVTSSYTAMDWSNMPSTSVKLEIGSNGVGSGGKVAVKYNLGSTYTLAENYSSAVKWGNYVSSDSSHINYSLMCKYKGSAGRIFSNFSASADITNASITLDRDFLETYAFEFWDDVTLEEYPLADMSTSELSALIDSITNKSQFAMIRVEVTGTHSSFTYAGYLALGGYTNNARVSNVSLDKSNMVV